MQWIRAAFALTAFALCGAACVVSREGSTDEAAVGDPGDENTAESAAAVLPEGCYPDSNTASW